MTKEEKKKKELLEEMKKVFLKFNNENYNKDILVGINQNNEIVTIVEDDFMGIFDAMFENNVINENEYFKNLFESSKKMIYSKKDKYKNRFLKKFNRNPDINEKDILIYNCWVEDDYKDYEIYDLILKYNNLKKIRINGNLYNNKSRELRYKRGIKGEILNGNIKE